MRAAFLRNRGARVIVLLAAVVIAGGAGFRWGVLRGAGPALPADGTPTILVAPFSVSNTTTEPWSGTGLAEEIRIALGANSSVAIRRATPTVGGATAPTSSDAASVRQVAATARSVGADYVLTGIVGRNGRNSEIALRLVRAADATTAWTGTFWRSPTDLSSWASELAAAVTEAVRAEETGRPKAGSLNRSEMFGYEFGGSRQ